MLRSIILSLAAALLLSFPLLAQSQTTTWYLCAILQASSYQSIDQAVLTVNSTAMSLSDYNGVMNPAYRVLNITSGSRTFTDLTAASPSPSTVAMANLAPIGSTGGNTNLFWPGTFPQLNGDGLTFNFVSAIPISGQASGMQMNLWWASGGNQLGEEVQGGTHETVPMQSTLRITQTQQACTVPNYAQFSMCLLINGNNYRTSISALVNTTGTAQRITATSGNGLSNSLQGWTVSSVSGQRVYTPTSGSATTTTLSGVAAANAVSSNDNLVFPDSAGNATVDAAGVAFTLASAAPFADGTTASSLAVKYANGNYYEQTPSAPETANSSFISFVPYYPGSALPPCAAIATQYQFFWSVNGSTNYTSVITGYMAVNPIAAGTAAKPYWNMVCVTGKRVYTDLTTGTTTTSNIQALLSTGHIGGNDNRLYIGGAQLVDGDGFSLQYDNIPPIYGQNGVNQTNTMNLWFDGTTNSYLEENRGGTHEVSPTSSNFIITPTSASYATCVPPTNTVVTGSSTGGAFASSTGIATSTGGGGPVPGNGAGVAVSFISVSALIAVALFNVLLQ